MKKLFSCLVALVALFSIFSCLQEERSPEEILVPSPAQVDCSESSFSLTSKVPSGSEKLVDACGFLVGTTKDLADAVTVEGTLNANTFAAALPFRKYGTTYYICSYVTNGHGSEIKSQVSSFEMGDFDDYVSFGKVSLVSYNPLTKLAEINIPVEILSVVNVTEAGVCYGADKSLSIDGTHAEGFISEDGILSVPLEGFTDGTQYYLRPYVSENDYIAYGEPVSFVIPSVPIVLTYPAEDVTSDSALLSGEVQRGEGITERGFVWLSGQSVPTIDSYKVKVDGTVGKFSASLNDLEAGGRFAYRAYVINNQGVFYGDILNFTTIAGLPTLSAMKVSDITMTSASFTCTVTSYGGDPVSEVGFYIGKEESVDIETALRISEAYTSDSFTLTATDLEVGTDYYVKAFTKNSVGESYSVIVSFKTVSTAPSVTTVGSSEITDSSVLLSGDVTDDNGEDITERGFVWLKGTGTPTTSNSKLRSDGTTGEYSATLSDLEPNQTYSYRSYAVNAKGTAYGESMTFRTKVALPEVVFVSCSDVTSSSAIVSGKVTSHGGETVSEVGFLYGTTSNLDFATSSKVTATYAGASFSFTLTSLTSVAEYYVQPFAKNSAGTAYGEVVSFTTLPELPVVTTSDVTDITDNSAVSGGVIVDDGGGDIIAKGVVWSRSKNPTVEDSFRTEDGNGSGSFTSHLSDLFSGSTYYVRAYATNSVGTSYGDQYEFRTTGETTLEVLKAANCFIISESGIYAFDSVRGNSAESVGSVSSVEVLWESYGTSEVPEVGSLVSSVSVEGDMIVFKVPEPYREGNAVIAAKDASGEILWSWHIWLTDEPECHVYNNNAGTMMDRNLGATSATPGDVGALGLLYQWGRKDPFLGSSSISSNTEVKSTITWPSTVSSGSSKGTVDYVTSHPTTFVTAGSSSSYDWHYSSRDNTLWQSEKTIYDPCPEGWRVPDGGGNGVWKTAGFTSTSYDSTNRGKSFSISNPSITWYPTAGWRRHLDGSLGGVVNDARYWSATPTASSNVYDLEFGTSTSVDPTCSSARAYAFSVRCLQEGTGDGTGDGTGGGTDGGTKYDNDFSTSGARNLSDEGTANSYIVSSAGTYSISPVKGNSSEPIGSVASAEVLWETFGTDENVIKGNLISGARYENGRIYFKTADTYREGNAVIAAKDVSGTILWSWHIWLTDQPQGQVYNNNAGTMMDRNLGATSATPGDVGALGLLYQWGRKDPFLGSASISSEVESQSTITWPSAVSSDSSTGTVDFVTSHPTTFVKAGSSSSYDWHYSYRDNTLWQSEKTIYDPCPVGWRVPDGGDEGVWSTAKGSSSAYKRSYDSTNEGMNFSGDFGSASTIWYPASGCRNSGGGALFSVGNYGSCWSVTPDSSYAYSLYFDFNGDVYPTDINNRAYGLSVRCLQEGTGGGTGGGTDGGTEYDNDFSTSGARNLSDEGTANSYIVSSAGTYSISPVKGNSSEPVGSVASAEVLWETFGTDENIIKGNLISGARYENGKIYFKTADAYREGNAVIAAKDASGEILWSWHIWLTDQPQGQIYNNNAGTMMDRNLGATSATLGDVGALGLLYQWGRKDPFLGSSSISSDVEAKSTITWPSPVSSDFWNGTIEYAISHPTTFIKYNSSNGDWYYTGSSSTDDTRWQSDKTIYDPCPAGWRVPDGGSSGVWNTAGFADTSYDSSNEGINFSISSPSTTWYPASGYRHSDGGALNKVGSSGGYWSVTTDSRSAYRLYFNSNGNVYPSYYIYRASGYSVRCLQVTD